MSAREEPPGLLAPPLQASTRGAGPSNARQGSGVESPANGHDGQLSDLQTARIRAATISFEPSTRPDVAAAPHDVAEQAQAGRRRGLSLSSFRRGAETNSLAVPHVGQQPPMSRQSSSATVRSAHEHNQQVTDLLDAIDPEVSAMTTLTDVQNSLFVPNFGAIFNRPPRLSISRQQPPRNPDDEVLPLSSERMAAQPPRTMPTYGPLMDVRNARQSTTVARPLPPGAAARYEVDDAGRPIRRKLTGATIEEQPEKEAGQPSKEEAAAVSDASKEKDKPAIQGDHLLLPKDLINWEEWTEEEKQELDDYVRHLRTSRKERFKRGFKGFLHYIRTPLGCFIFVYASLLTFWGAAWILFIIGWISVGDRQDYFVEICDQILTALFCVVGIGLFPFRLYDTYHMIYIVHYHRKILRLRQERGFPQLQDPNEIPVEEAHDEMSGFNAAAVSMNANGSLVGKVLPDGSVVCTTTQDLEAAHALHHGVLTDEEYESFLHHQHKFGKSHTFYRPHESVTHHAFPLDLMIVVISLLDFHSCFQIALGSLTWSVSYHHDWKHKVTAVILSISISVNIAAGIVIAVGNSKTRKKEIIERLFRQAITEEALKRAERNPTKHPLPLGRTDSGHVALLPPKPVHKKSAWPSRHHNDSTESAVYRTSRTNTGLSGASDPELGAKRTSTDRSGAS